MPDNETPEEPQAETAPEPVAVEPEPAPSVPPAPTDAEPGSRQAERIDLPDVQFQRVAPAYLVVSVVGLVISGLIATAVALVLWLVLGWSWVAWTVPVIAAIFLVSIAIEPRRVKSIGYALRADDLVFRRGIMFQRFVSVPYGRMQLVDITRGPVSRMLGLADLHFVTAAAATGVAIPGLREADAESLRDELVALAESRRAGL